MPAVPKVTEDEYRYCARVGMTQAEAARHLGVSRASVQQAKVKYGLVFGMAWQFTPEGREMEMVYFRYPWADFSVGDWIKVKGAPCVIANRANRANPGKKFATRQTKGFPIVVRVA
jgi:hypothetical protein